MVYFDWKKVLTKSMLLIILVNIIMLFSAWYYGWKAAEVLAVYVFETLVIFGFSIIKSFICSANLLITRDENTESEAVFKNQTQALSGFTVLIAFLLLFGMFVYVIWRMENYYPPAADHMLGLSATNQGLPIAVLITLPQLYDFLVFLFEKGYAKTTCLQITIHGLGRIMMLLFLVMAYMWMMVILANSVPDTGKPIHLVVPEMLPIGIFVLFRLLFEIGEQYMQNRAKKEKSPSR